MPATITIPASAFAGVETVISFRLVDTHGRPYPGALADNSAFLGGVLRDTFGAADTAVSLPCQDEIPAPPGQTGTFWRITVHDGRDPSQFNVAITSTNPPTTWNELIAAGTPQDPADLWSGRLLSADERAAMDLAAPSAANRLATLQDVTNAGVIAFQHVQSVPSAAWTVNHNLGTKPAVELLDAGGAEVDAEVIHTSDNQFIAYFSVAVAGRARCL